MIEMSFLLTSHPAAVLHLLWPDLIYFLFSFFTITHSLLIASCSTNRVHCISSCCCQPKRALILILILSGFFPSIFTSYLLYQPVFQGTLQGSPQHHPCCLAVSLLSFDFISSFLAAELNTTDIYDIFASNNNVPNFSNFFANDNSGYSAKRLEVMF